MVELRRCGQPRAGKLATTRLARDIMNSGSSLGFGLERLGLLAIGMPRATCIVMLAVTIVSVAGLAKLRLSESIEEFFRSESSQHVDKYREMKKAFPATEQEVLAVFEGNDLLRRDTLEAVRDLHLELQLVEPVASVLSIFAIREPPDDTGYAAPLLPNELPEGAAFERLIDRVQNHPLIYGNLLSKPDSEARVMMMIISLKKSALSDRALGPAFTELERTISDVLGETGLIVRLTGTPAMMRDTLDGIRHDRIVFGLVSFLIGAAVGWVFFRRPKLVLLVCLCPLLSIIWLLGLLGFIGQSVNLFINIIPAVIMVIAFSDAVHMVFAVRQQLRRGRSRFEAAHHAVTHVGPACVMTALTTAISLLCLLLTDSQLIREFGIAAALGTLISYVTVITLVPALSVLLLDDELSFAQEKTGRHQALEWLDRGCATLGAWLERHYGSVTWIGVLLVALFLYFHFQLEPKYRMIDLVPDDTGSTAAAERIDLTLGGVQPIHIMVAWPSGHALTSETVLGAIGAAHDLLQSDARIGGVLSLATIDRLVAKSASNSRETLLKILSDLPDPQKVHLFNDQTNQALVSARIANLPASDIIRVEREIDVRLTELAKAHPDIGFTVTSLATMSAHQNMRSISQLNIALFTAIVICIILLGVALRSIRAALVSILPNLFPVVAAGTYLHVSGLGLQLAGVVGLTVAFGLAVNDTVHFLHRLHLEQDRSGRLGEAVVRTIAHIGPVLSITTVILVCGFSGTLFSDFGATRMFGELCMVTFVAALAGDMLFLPALILATSRR